MTISSTMINSTISFVAVIATIRQVTANPMPNPAPQAVTERVAPDLPPPPGCTIDFVGPFAIVVNPLAPQARVRRRWDIVTQIDDGQPQVVPGVVQIPDGQVQAPARPVTKIHDGQIQAPGPPVTQIHDGQIQAPGHPVNQMGGGQIQAHSVNQISDGQIQAFRRQTPQFRQRVCSTDAALRLNLANGVLKDALGRTGYIASNFQFQFDEPPQAGAIYTAGFSACENGTLALGGNTVFYRCLSGDFYNLYDRWWAEQCSPVALDLAELIDC